jgi:hypothetical protein
MPEPFAIGDEPTHVIGDAPCPECLEEHPEHMTLSTRKAKEALGLLKK